MSKQDSDLDFEEFVLELAELAKENGFSDILDNEGNPYCFISSAIEYWLCTKFPNLNITNHTVSLAVSIIERKLPVFDVEEDRLNTTEESHESVCGKDYLTEDDEWCLERRMEFLGYHYDLPNEYTEDWGDISEIYRLSVGWICEDCGVDLASNKFFLHVHHLDRNKKNNKNENLRALCVQCHSDQPGHGHMKLDRNFVNSREQILRNL